MDVGGSPCKIWGYQLLLLWWYHHPWRNWVLGGQAMNQVIQWPCPFHPLVGGHDSPFKMGHVFTNPKKGNKESPGMLKRWLFLRIFGQVETVNCWRGIWRWYLAVLFFPNWYKVDVFDIGLYWNVFYVDILNQFLAVLVGFGNPHSLRGFSFSSPPAYPHIVYSDPKLVFHPFPFPWFIRLNLIRLFITLTNHLIVWHVLHSLNSINHNLWVENPMIGNSSVHKGYSPPKM